MPLHPRAQSTEHRHLVAWVSRVAVTLALFLCALAGPIPLCRAGAPPQQLPKPMLIIVALAYGVRPQTIFGPPSSMPTALAAAVAGGSPGLINTATTGSRGRADTYASVAFGSRSRGTAAAGSARPELSGSKAVIDMASIVQANRRDSKGYGAKPGAVADSLARAGVTMAVFGNADSESGAAPHREAALLIASSAGVVPEAHFGPSGQTGFAGTLVALEAWSARELALGHKALGVVELGTGTQRALAKRLAAVCETTASLSSSASTSSEVALILGSPGPYGASRADSLAPALVWYPGHTTGAVLTSSSTRRVGIALNTDISATLLSLFGARIPVSVTGRPLYGVAISKSGLAKASRKDPASWLLYVREQAVAKTKLRTIFATAYVGYLIIVFWYLVCLYALRRRQSSLGLRFPNRLILVWAALLVCWWPVVIFLLGLSAPGTIPTYAVSTGLFLGAGVYLTPRAAADPMKTIRALALGMCALVAFDQLYGGSMVAGALMSYDVQTGARFYGLGNEYMGIAVGAFITWMGVNKDLGKHSPVDAGILGLLLALTIGAPVVGANMGGMITAIPGFGATLVLLSGRRMSGWTVIALAAGTALAVVGMSTIDIHLGMGATHIGHAAEQVGAEGLREAFRIVSRKVLMNLRIIAYTPWNLVFLSVVGYLIANTGASTRNRLFRSLRVRHPGMSVALRGALIASVVALLFNDSGIVASSLSMVFPFYGFCFVLMAEEVKRENPGP